MLALAVVYAVVPMFNMPGYTLVWGWGAVIFLALAVLIAAVSREQARRARHSRKPETERANGT